MRTVDDFGKTGDGPDASGTARLSRAAADRKEMVNQVARRRDRDVPHPGSCRRSSTKPPSVSIRITVSLASQQAAPRSGSHPRCDAHGLRAARSETATCTYLREVGEGNVGQNVFEPVIRQISAKTRSVYLPRVRNVLPEILDVFDAPDASLVTGARETTSSPLQSLFLMNNEFVQQQAEGLSQRIEKKPAPEQLNHAWLIALGRQPSEAERNVALAFHACAWRVRPE